MSSMILKHQKIYTCNMHCDQQREALAAYIWDNNNNDNNNKNMKLWRPTFWIIIDNNNNDDNNNKALQKQGAQFFIHLVMPVLTYDTYQSQQVCRSRCTPIVTVVKDAFRG